LIKSSRATSETRFEGTRQQIGSSARTGDNKNGFRDVLVPPQAKP